MSQSDRPQTTRESEQERLGRSCARGGFQRVPPHDEPAACREAWLRGYDNVDAAGRAQHQTAAKMIADLAASQVRNAMELGRHAAGMGMSHAENPFVSEFPNKSLADAWASGWVMGNEGIER